MSVPRRILVLSASAGAGHLRAAQALEAACRGRFPEAEVLHLDALELTPASFRRVYGQGYLDFVNHAPELLGVLYARTNRPPRHKAADRLRLLVERLNARPFVRFLRDFEPDVVAHTHFLAPAVIAHETRRGRAAPSQLVVVTDFEVHRFWLCPGVDAYCVAREDNAHHLAALGVSPARVHVTGIPIDPVFAREPDLRGLRRKHGIEGDLPLLLVLCGGFGVGPVEALVESLLRDVSGAQITIVAGKNEALRRRLERRAGGANLRVRVLGFTTEIHEWMALASLAVTKPGGLTTSEALAVGLPLVIANPIPGQETRNATMLYEEGAAISGENPFTVGARIARLLRAPERLQLMRRAALRLGRPGAALDVADQIGRLAAGT